MADAARMQASPPIWIFAIVAWGGTLVLLFVAFRRYSDPAGLRRRVPFLIIGAVVGTLFLFVPLIDPATPVPLFAGLILVVLPGIFRRATHEDLLDVQAVAAGRADATFRRLFTGWLTIGLGGLALIDVARILG